MMISRRPKRRASKENAPGPSRTRQIEIADKFNAVRMHACRVNATLGSQGQSKNPPARNPNAAEMLAMGVSRPISSAIPIKREMSPGTHAGRISGGIRSRDTE